MEDTGPKEAGEKKKFYFDYFLPINQAIDKINERFPKILFFCIILNQLKSVCDVELWIYCMDLQILLTHTNSQHIGSIDLFNWLNEFVHLLIEKSSFLECLSNVLNISCN